MTGTATPNPGGEHQRVSAQDDASALFLRYCRGRPRRMVARIAVAFVGVAAFGLLHDVRLAILAGVIVLLGECAETSALRSIAARFGARGLAPSRARLTACLAGAVQALSVAFSVAIVGTMGDDGETELLGSIFLAGAAMDAGVAIRFERRAVLTKLATYLVAFLALESYYLYEHPLAGSLTGGHGFDLIGSLILMLISIRYIAFTAQTHDRKQTDERRVVEKHERLLAARHALEAKGAEARRLALVAQHANDGVIIYSDNGVIEWVNETFTRMTGYGYHELVGYRIENVIPADDLDPEGVAALIDARRRMVPYRGEIKTRRRSGDIIWIEANLTPIDSGAGTGPIMIAVERDITETKAREAELARARAAAEDAAKAKAQFLATMSHEIRTPMNGVIGTAELLWETRLDNDQQLYVDTIVDSGRALLTIINDILDLSRLQAGAPLLVRSRLDLGECVTRAAELLRPTARAKGITLDLRKPEGSGPMVLADGGRLRQIVLNLLGNAIKFTETGGVTITLTNRMADGSTAHHIELAVADTGTGIAPDRLGAVFDSFTQADGEIGRKFGGTGLGLTISRRLAEEMGGGISVASEEGQGSVFTLSLRLDAAPAEPAATLSSPYLLTRRADVATALPSLLVVEDNRTNTLIVERMLRSLGYEMRFAVEGNAAIAAFCEAAPDLVLMDISMPGMNGFEALRAIRDIERHRTGNRCPVIALTANGYDEDRRACFAAGFDGFATKPIDKQALIAEITRCAEAASHATVPIPPAPVIESARPVVRRARKGRAV